MQNDLLRDALNHAGWSVTRLASEVGVDNKTVERWISQSRIPHARHRVRVAEVLGTEPALLWPSSDRDATGAGELVTMYPTRRAAPAALWRTLMATTTSEFDMQAFAATFLPDQTVDLAAELVTLADRGVRVRLLLGDPDGRAVQLRDTEEGGTGLAGRIRLVLGYIATAVAHPGVEVRLHDHTLYASLFRFDDDLLVNPHVWGSPAGNNPLLHLHRRESSPLIESWLAGYERVWAEASTLDAWPR